MDEIITTPKPTEPLALVRRESDTDAEWQKKERDYAPLKMAYDLKKTKWNNANKKCVAVIKNRIDPNILGSIGECDSTAEYLEKIKNQFAGSSKTYATQIIEQLVTKRYYVNAGTIRDHIMGMCLELQAQTNELVSQGRVYGAPGVCLSAKRVCNFRCKL